MSAGGGVQSLCGQCPNVGGVNAKGCSLKSRTPFTSCQYSILQFAFHLPKVDWTSTQCTDILFLLEGKYIIWLSLGSVLTWAKRKTRWFKGQVFHTATNQISSPKFIIRNLHCSPCLVCVDICIIMGCVCIYCLKCGTYRKWMAEVRWRAAEAFTREPERELRLWSNVKYNVFFAFLFVQYSLKLHVTLPG